MHLEVFYCQSVSVWPAILLINYFAFINPYGANHSFFNNQYSTAIFENIYEDCRLKIAMKLGEGTLTDPKVKST